MVAKHATKHLLKIFSKKFRKELITPESEDGAVKINQRKIEDKAPNKRNLTQKMLLKYILHRIENKAKK